MLIFRLEIDRVSFFQAWWAVSQRADIGKVSHGSHRSNFFGLVHLIISEQSFPSFLQAQRSQSASSLIYPLWSVTSVSSSSLNNTSHPLPLPSALCSSSRTCSCLCRAKKRWKRISQILEGACCYLTQGQGFLHCHAFAFANFRVCLLWSHLLRWYLRS